MIWAALFLISAVVLGLELILARTFAIGHWHHFAYLIISTALLGFGAGGTFVTLFASRLKKDSQKSLWLLALLMGISIPAAFSASQILPLDELQLIWDSRQALYIFGYYLLFCVPFFFAGSFIALVFASISEKINHLYFFNLTGSGFGAVLAVVLMYGRSPEQLIILVSAMVFVAAMVLTLRISFGRLMATVVTAAAVLLMFGSAGPFRLSIRISENKSLVYYRNVPDADILATCYSPLARLDCIKAPSIRYFPGLSLAYDGELPEQMLIISDADGASMVNSFEAIEDLSCYKRMTSSLAYELLNEPQVCVIGSGGGSDVVQALAGGATNITAVEMNRHIVELMRGELSQFCGRLYDRDDVEVVIAEGRSFLQTTEREYDLISISLLDSYTAASAGLYSLNESHLYTIEAIEQCFNRLRPGGLLSVTRIIKLPPRDSLKMMATISQVLRNRGVAEPAEHLMMIRSLLTATLVASPTPFSKDQVESARRFATLNSFDLVHVPGITDDQANQFDVLDEPVYYNSVQRILSASAYEFYSQYSYNIKPATDDRPYFFDFFKWRSLPKMINEAGRHWLVFSEWGYLVLIIILLQALIASGVLILLPRWVSTSLKGVGLSRFCVLVYFAALGLGYMFLEMGFIAKLTLLMGRPVFGIAATLAGFLFFSGLGSLASRFVSIRSAVLAIVLLGFAEVLLLRFSFGWLIGFPFIGRGLLALGIVAPLGFFMGMPFPIGLGKLHVKARPLVPWAWAVNGFASVVGAVLGTVLAISVGFTVLVLAALACYLLALIYRIEKQ